MATIHEELESLLARLSEADQRRLLEYARALASAKPFPLSPQPPGSPPDALQRIHVSPEVGEAMERALNDCELADLKAQLAAEEEQDIAAGW